jgi:hypothetical protein
MTEQEAIALARRIPFVAEGGVRGVGIGSREWPPEIGSDGYYAYAEVWAEKTRVILRGEQQLAAFVASLSDPAAPDLRRPRSPRR